MLTTELTHFWQEKSYVLNVLVDISEILTNAISRHQSGTKRKRKD